MYRGPLLPPPPAFFLGFLINLSARYTREGYILVVTRLQLLIARAPRPVAPHATFFNHGATLLKTYTQLYSSAIVSYSPQL